ncbi:putative Ig domain-containing protein [Corynebacterium sp.]|uniref:Ig domain-containing protein n=1 Tax=Corynebacterium sp. TaxID=1720 RepID=UPI0028AC8D27|nr:putative Ig domain-containing protein [Corynebacterium sp.]
MAEQTTLQGFNAGGARVGMTGAVRHAPLGTAPVPLGTKYDTNKHTNMGYLSPDGLEISFDEERQEFIPWQEVAAIRTDITKSVKQIQFTLWETSLRNIAKFLGVRETDIKEENGVFSFWEGSIPEFPPEWLALDVVDGDKALRLTLPAAEIAERGSMIFKKDEMFGLQVTYNTQPAGEEYAAIPEAVGKTANWQFNNNWAQGTKDTSSTTDGVSPLVFQTLSDLGETEQDVVAETLYAIGGTKPYTFSVTSGALPAGTQLEPSTGEITGEATETGEFTFTVQVRDATNLTASREFKLTVIA